LELLVPVGWHVQVDQGRLLEASLTTKRLVELGVVGRGNTRCSALSSCATDSRTYYRGLRLAPLKVWPA
jgi:hypothetical protein